LGSAAWNRGQAIDESIVEAIRFLYSLRSLSSQLSIDGLETSGMDRFMDEAHSRLREVESALHSVGQDWEELTGLAKVKMMAARNLSRDYVLERRIRAVLFLIIALLAAAILALLGRRLRLIEKDQFRRHLLGSPEARQKGKDRSGK
jgi:hypothetical protein